MKSYIALDFKSGLGDASLAQFTANILTRVRGNNRFTAIMPFVDSRLQPAYEQYNQALQAAADYSRTKIAEKRQYREVLIATLEDMTSQIYTLPEVTDAVILEAGFHLRNRSYFRSEGPEQVQQLRVVAGEHTGEALLIFKTVKQARTYGLEWSGDGGQNWNNGTFSTSGKAVLTGLPTRQELWFRVYAIGSQQRKGAPSAPALFFLI